MKIVGINDFDVFKERFIEECSGTGVLDITNKEELIMVKEAAEAVLENRYKNITWCQSFNDMVKIFDSARFAFVNELTGLSYIIYKDEYGHNSVFQADNPETPLNGITPSYFHFLRFDDATDTSKYVQVVRGNKDVKTFFDVLKECVLENINKLLEKEDKV